MNVQVKTEPTDEPGMSAELSRKAIRDAKEELRVISAQLPKATYAAGLLMRGIQVEHVAAEWDGGESLDRAVAFWSKKHGRFSDYAKSLKVNRADCFVSHSWSQPVDWADIMGSSCSYAYIKTITLACIAQDLKGDEDWKSLTVW
eukprot:6114412-Amphidinium_carterae.1